MENNLLDFLMDSFIPIAFTWVPCWVVLLGTSGNIETFPIKLGLIVFTFIFNMLVSNKILVPLQVRVAIIREENEVR